MENNKHRFAENEWQYINILLDFWTDTFLCVCLNIHFVINTLMLSVYCLKWKLNLLTILVLCQALDFVISEAQKNGIRLILSLSTIYMRDRWTPILYQSIHFTSFNFLIVLCLRASWKLKRNLSAFITIIYVIQTFFILSVLLLLLCCLPEFLQKLQIEPFWGRESLLYHYNNIYLVLATS